MGLHVIDNVRAKFAAFDLGRIFHLARKIIGDAFAADGAIQALQN